MVFLIIDEVMMAFVNVFVDGLECRGWILTVIAAAKASNSGDALSRAIPELPLSPAPEEN